MASSPKKGTLKSKDVPPELRRMLDATNRFSKSIRNNKRPFEAETLIIAAGRKNDNGNGGKRHDFVLEFDGEPADIVEGLSRLVKRLQWEDFENLMTTMLGNLQPYAFASIVTTILYGDELRAQREASQPQPTGMVN